MAKLRYKTNPAFVSFPEKKNPKFEFEIFYKYRASQCIGIYILEFEIFERQFTRPGYCMRDEAILVSFLGWWR